jgi:peptidoglycan/LPS O-acetylase OafA/YrhL
MSALQHPHSPFLSLPHTGIGRVAAVIGVPTGVIELVLLLTSAGANSAGLAFLTAIAVFGTMLGGVLALLAVARQRERSLLVLAVLALAAFNAIFIGVEILFPHA